jgi:CRISPR/Cas system-associated protein Cas10 (large subunit of type III CRISPR-Cas system)
MFGVQYVVSLNEWKLVYRSDDGLELELFYEDIDSWNGEEANNVTYKENGYVIFHLADIGRGFGGDIKISIPLTPENEKEYDNAIKVIRAQMQNQLDIPDDV